MKLWFALGALAVLAVLGLIAASTPVGVDAVGRLLPPTATPTSTPTPVFTATPTSTPTPVFTATPTSTPTPVFTTTPTFTPTPVPPVSLLEKNTMLTFYGRGFEIGPILGILGFYKDTDDMEQQIARYVKSADAVNGDKGILPTIHLIYGLAIPCSPGEDCLLYLDTAGIDIVKEYIEPAAKRGWQVILDSQNGRASPMKQVKRMIDRGYLKYDNVHVAIDPEFASVPGHDLPGIPIGTLDASEINQVQQMLDDYVQTNGLRNKKVLIVHQFGDPNVDDGVPFMIRNKQALKTFANVELVIDADGFGGPGPKVNKYNKMTDDTVYPFIRFRGIKLFHRNPLETAGHFDRPMMDFDAVLGQVEVADGVRMRYPPDVIIIA